MPAHITHSPITRPTVQWILRTPKWRVRSAEWIRPTHDTVSRMARTKTSYTLTEAAHATGRSRATLRRYLDAGRFPGAFQETTDDPFPAWRIPSTDLIANGLTPDPDRTRAASIARPIVRATDEPGPTSRVVRLEAVAEERARTIETLTLELAETRRALLDALATVRALTTKGGE